MKRSAAAPGGVQLLLVVVVCFAWIAVLFLPVPTDVRVGVQAAMMVVLGAYFGVQIIRSRSGSATPVHEDERDAKP
jgi:hypothetical protein